MNWLFISLDLIIFSHKEAIESLSRFRLFEDPILSQSWQHKLKEFSYINQFF